MAGIDRIIEKILRDAGNEAEETIRIAEMAAASFLDKSAADNETQRKKIAADASLKAAGIKRRAISAEELELQKETLKVKQQLLDEVYTRAEEKLKRLPDKQYATLLADLAVKAVCGLNAESTEARAEGEVLVAEADRKRLPGDFTARVNTMLAGKGVESRISLSDKAAGIAGGIIYKTGNIEINSSFKAILHSERENLEPEIVGMLFKK